MKNVLVLASAVLVLGACATDPNTGQKIYGNTARGAGIGALGGAAIGVLAGGNDARNVAIGAAVGALAGAGVGGYMDKQEAELRRKTANTGIDVVRNGDQLELRMPSDVTFAVNDANIQSQFYPTLGNVVETLVTYPQTAIDVIGHADSDGSDSYNQALSERRAVSVRDFLVSRGVQPVRLIASGRGESQPLAPNTSVENKARNRRVQIVLTPVTDAG